MLKLGKGLNGNLIVWWAIVGFFVTLFAFFGVNMFLSSLYFKENLNHVK